MDRIGWPEALSINRRVPVARWRRSTQVDLDLLPPPARKLVEEYTSKLSCPKCKVAGPQLQFLVGDKGWFRCEGLMGVQGPARCGFRFFETVPARISGILAFHR